MLYLCLDCKEESSAQKKHFLLIIIEIMSLLIQNQDKILFVLAPKNARLILFQKYLQRSMINYEPFLIEKHCQAPETSEKVRKVGE